MLGTWIGGSLVVGSLAAGVGAVALMGYLYRHRQRPGAVWFCLASGGVALWCLAYGVGLLVSTETVREGLEALMWIGMIWTGPLFFAFGLEYTGRGDVLRTWPFKALFLVPTLVTVLLVTVPLHDLVWQEFERAPIFGVETVLYSIQPIGYAAVLFGIVLTFLGVLLLVETVVSYGPLYRREAIAVSLSTVFPSAGLLLWLSGIGPFPAVNLVPVLFLPHLLLDAYAFVGKNMFDQNPTTRRAAERTAIDDLPNPIVIVDTEGRIVEHNTVSNELFDDEDTSVLGQSLTAQLDIETDDSGMPRDGITLVQRSRNGPTRHYIVSTSPLIEPAGRTVGRTVVFQNVTDQREREQQLTVLNRVLRHNLRSELTVVMGMAEMIDEAVDDPEVNESIDQLRESGRALENIVKRAREFERVRDHTPRFEQCAVEELLDRVVADLPTNPSDAEVRLEDVDPVELSTEPILLGIIVSNLLSNAVVHSDRAASAVVVRGRISESAYVIEIEDDGPGIPVEELAVLERGMESALEHGSGLGLWITTWAAERIGVDLEFDVDGTGTTVTVSIPLSREREGSGQAVSQRESQTSAQENSGTDTQKDSRAGTQQQSGTSAQ